ncbi:MAG: glycosyltransferase family 25 protein [Rhizobiales bacterium]|nr:glycosyltransferase family 25 protein [Hyphomicrobiales bacterium]MBI3672421.1 glycosyltransferase family 25 protein [Hyphomicrobiales bacterium]
MASLEREEDGDPEALRDRLIAAASQHLAAGRPEAALDSLRGLSAATIDETALAASDRLFAAGLRRAASRVATCDPARQPAPGEQVIVYGNYPHCYDNLLVNAQVRRHVSWFWNIPHDACEFDRAWDGIGRIYIINQSSRPDRLDMILNELARARAPFDRIECYAAEEAGPADVTGAPPALRGAIGCLQSHLAVAGRIARSNHQHSLVLEDDFSFTSDLDLHRRDLAAFTQSSYDYAVCLLGTSKYGRLVPRDDLVCYSMQPCTNAEAYLVSPGGARDLLVIWREALAKLIETGEAGRYATDRSWCALQEGGRFLVFRRKMGFQASSYSSIEGGIARYFD